MSDVRRVLRALVGACAWGVHLLGSYVLATELQVRAVLGVFAIACAAPSVIAAIFASRDLRAPTTPGRHFVDVTAVVLDGFFTFVILAETIPTLFLHRGD